MSNNNVQLPDMNDESLADKIKKAPKEPGVYMFLGNNKKPLYIGKALNLRNRLASYPRSTDMRIRKMLDMASFIRIVPTGSEIEALILESQLIKKHIPQYNVMLRDDKRYFYVEFSSDEFPKIKITHQPAGIYSSIYSKNSIGPFTEGTALKETLKTLRKIFPYCTCKQKHNLKCLNSHIGKCPGFCCLKSAPSAKDVITYRNSIKSIQNLLNGKKSRVLLDLKKSSQDFARAGDFKTATLTKRRMEYVSRVFENARVIRALPENNSDDAILSLTQALGLKKPPHRIEGYDIANIQGQYAVGSMAVFIAGRPDKSQYRKFNIKTITGPNDTAMLGEVITRRLNHPEWPYPDLILIDGGKGQLGAVRFALENASTDIKTIAITKDDRHKGDKITLKNPAGRFIEVKLSEIPESASNLLSNIDNEAHRFAIRHYRKRHRFKFD